MSHLDTRRYTAASLCAATALGLAVSIVPASVAVADEGVTWESPTSTSIEYGEGWGFRATAVGWDTTRTDPDLVHVDVENAPPGYKPGEYSYVSYDNHASGISTISVTESWETRPLPAGTYTIDLYLAWDDQTSHAAGGPVSLTVSPAPMGIDLRVLADASNPTAAIVTAKFTGRFVDQYQSSLFAQTALSPAGEWRIVVKEEDGTVAVERAIERAAGDDVLATSFYWTEAELDREYTATAEFVPTGASSKNFAFTAATAVSYTAQPDPRPTPSSSATATPEMLPEPAGFALPLWTVILDLLLIAALGTLVTILIVRLRKRPAAPDAEATEK